MRQSRFSNPEHLRLINSPSWSLCEGLIKAFEERWLCGQAPAIADYLRAEGPARRALLLELVHVDLEFRLKAGESARVETYLVNYPELGADRQVTMELIAAEYKLRQRHQGSVTLEEFQARFPDCLQELRNRLAPNRDETRFLSREVAASVRPRWPAVPGYEIVGEIGRGGMGIIYKAREPSLGRHVALKFLPEEYVEDPDRLERFLREARTASALNHPHICTVHALGEHEERPFIVMEFIEGTTLQALVKRRPGVEEVARLIGQAARALAAAHTAGVVHRDIKPDNIMVRADGYVKVLDFGLARCLPSFNRTDQGRRRDTDPNALLGTVAYMSPEQTRGSAADQASDIFSLGIVLYQLTTGKHPFEAESALRILHAIRTGSPPPPSQLNPDIPAVLDALIAAMLRKDARLRPDATKVEADLAALVGPGTGQSGIRTAPRTHVRREPELAALHAALASAAGGRGSLVCVAGEPGIGKTTLIEDFLVEAARSGRSCLVARGHCSERLADTEAYLPVIDALQSLLRSEARKSVARMMKVVAPTWEAQLVLDTRGPATTVPPKPTQTSSQQGMLREFVNLLRELCILGPVVLFFDDVHWSDVPTVDLLAYLGRLCQALRVLIIVTYRPTELLLGPHPFHRVKLELQGQGACCELSLGFLGRKDIDHYLILAYPGHDFPADFADLVYSRTEGSPLFMVELLRYLRDRGVIAVAGGRWGLARQLLDVWQELPESVRGMIQRKLERLDENDRWLLAAASVQGTEFDSAVVGEVLKLDATEVEECLQVLDRVHGLVRRVREYEFPDRQLTLRYAFVHSLYQQGLYAGLSPSRRASIGVALARALENHHGPDNPSAAAELACLYEVGRDFGRAARQCWLAAQNAARVFAHQEAVALARRGLRLLGALPETPGRAALELPLQMTLGLQLQVTEGYAAPAVKLAYTRARELCSQAPQGVPMFPVRWGLWLWSKVRSELAQAQEMAEELFELAQLSNDPSLALQAHQALGVTALCRGVPAAALRHSKQVAALYDPHRHHTLSFQFGQDPGVICKAYGAVVLWLLGFPDEAQRHSDVAIQWSQQRSPTCQAVALFFAAMLHQLCRNGSRSRVCAEASAAIASEHGFSFWRAGGSVLSGWALAVTGAEDEGLQRMRQGLRDWQATGSITYQTYYLGLLAAVLGGKGEVEEGARVLHEALDLVRQTGEGLYEAELHRLQGELLLRGAGNPTSEALRQAREHFRAALGVARRQESKSLELRAVMSVARLGQRLGPWEAERALLAETYQRFTEGFQTADLREAKALLENPT